MMEKKIGVSIPVIQPRLRTTTLSRVLVCVDSTHGREYAGRIYTAIYENPMRFQNWSQFCQGMDRLFDGFRFPQVTHEYRSFRKGAGGEERMEDAMLKPREELTLPSEAGEAGTFIVHVQFRQNASWQGKIQWVEGKKTQSFRSTLELMKLMDEALHHEDDPPRATWDED